MRTFTVTLSDEDEAVLLWQTDQANAAIVTVNATQVAGATISTVTSDDVFNGIASAIIESKREAFTAYKNAQRIAAIQSAPAETVTQIDALLGLTPTAVITPAIAPVTPLE